MIDCIREYAGMSSFARIAGLSAVLAAATPTNASANPTYEVLYAFSKFGASQPSELVADEAGNFYGKAWFPNPGQCLACVAIYKLTPDGSFDPLISFDIREGPASLVGDIAGKLWFTTYSHVTLFQAWKNRGAIGTIGPDGKVTYIHDFAGSPNDGLSPVSTFVRDNGGTFYGVTYHGGTSLDPDCGVDYPFFDPAGCGTVYKFAPDGSGYEVIHNFEGGDAGSNPRSGPIVDPSGNLFGIAGRVVFKLTPDKTFSVLHRFAGGTTDGSFPTSLVMDGFGTLYGATQFGGGTGCGGRGCGTIFKIEPDGGDYEVLYSFTGGSDGDNPFVDLVDAAGNLFGRTNGLYETGCAEVVGSQGCGTLFSLPAGGTGFRVLHAFAKDGSDGAVPSSRLIADASGNLYGTTEFGGPECSSRQCGTLFKLSKAGYVPPEPLKRFKADLVTWSETEDEDAFIAKASFVPGDKGDTFDPSNEPFVLALGPFSASIPPGLSTLTIPPGSFTRRGHRRYDYEGKLGGARIRAIVERKDRSHWQLKVAARGVDLEGIENPVPLVLTIGGQRGSSVVESDNHCRPRHRNRHEARSN
jgi:uncharacterized repeat protein (TIGR03803 family)